MGILQLLSCWVFGAEVHALGSTDFPTRSAADGRLLAVGWWAYPALTAGLESAVPERAARCEHLIDRLTPPAAVYARHLDRVVSELTAAPDPVPELTPAAWLVLEDAVCRAAIDCAPIRVRAWDGQRDNELYGGFRQWVRTPNFYAADHPGDVRVLCEGVRVKRQPKPAGE